MRDILRYEKDDLRAEPFCEGFFPCPRARKVPRESGDHPRSKTSRTDLPLDRQAKWQAQVQRAPPLASHRLAERRNPRTAHNRPDTQLCIEDKPWQTKVYYTAPNRFPQGVAEFTKLEIISERRDSRRRVADELVGPLDEPLHVRCVGVPAIMLAPGELPIEQPLVHRRHLRGAIIFAPLRFPLHPAA